MNRSSIKIAAVALAALLSGSQLADACFMRSIQPVQVWIDHINVDITDQVAVKTYQCGFKNPNSQAVVGGTCFMELEPGAQVDNMTVTVDGQEMKAEILDVEKAKEVFTEMVKNGSSPALLEYFGNQLIQTQVPRIAPNGMVMVRLQYTMVLPKRDGLVRMSMLNTNPKALVQTLQSASVTVNIKSQEPIKNLYSPTHEIEIGEKEGWDVTASWKQENYTPKHPFVLYYQTGSEKVGASLVAHRDMNEEGSFMLMLSPTVGNGQGKITDEQILPKDVVFCVDTSGSMLKGGKMEQARGALKYCVENLRKGDRFNIVDFSTVARNFSENLVELNDESRAKALQYVEDLSARGGTAIQEALDLSLKQLSGESDRLKMIVFATDGLPTIGEREPEKILQHVAKQNTQDVRIFVFGEGYDVNAKLLDFLAIDHRGEADYILPEEDITAKISKFFDRVGSPIMSDLQLSYEGLEVKDVFPRQIADVYKGEQVILYGRYTGHGEKKVKLTGTVNGQKQTYEYTLTFPEYSQDDKNAFVPRLWAGQKVDYLLSEIRKQETMSQELVDEVTYLAKRYGIVTPYTSYLVTDDVVGDSVPEGVPANNALGGARFKQSLEEKAAQQNAPAPSAPQIQSAKRETEQRRNASRGKLAAYDEAVEQEAQTYGYQNRNALTALRYIGNRTFYKKGRYWQQSEFDNEKEPKTRVVKVGTDEYFELLKQDTRVAQQLALGEVIFQVGKEWIQIEQDEETPKPEIPKPEQP